jgi:peroxiredoxin
MSIARRGLVPAASVAGVSHLPACGGDASAVSPATLAGCSGAGQGRVDAASARAARRRAALEALDLALAPATGLARRPGERAPGFALPDAAGARVALGELLMRGPVVVAFFRGGWSPPCRAALAAWAAARPALEAAGARLVLLSPQTPLATRATARGAAAGLALLSDRAARAADAYGVVATVPPSLRARCVGAGLSLPRLNGTEDWRLPAPAAFVVGRDGVVAAALTGAAAPGHALAALARL